MTNFALVTAAQLHGPPRLSAHSISQSNSRLCVILKPRLSAQAELLPLSLSQLQQLRLGHPLAELALWVAALAALEAAIAVPHRRALAADALGGAPPARWRGPLAASRYM
jgi:hypothetical protein